MIHESMSYNRTMSFKFVMKIRIKCSVLKLLIRNVNLNFKSLDGVPRIDIYIYIYNINNYIYLLFNTCGIRKGVRSYNINPWVSPYRTFIITNSFTIMCIVDVHRAHDARQSNNKK